MTTDNEKLCMAIVNNSTITNINWAGVGAALGGLKVNSVQKRWKRFKDTSTAENSTNKQPENPTMKNGANGSKKREIAEVSGDGEEAVRRLPARKARGKKAKIQTPSSDEDEDYGEWAVKEESKTDEDDFVGGDYEEA
jgi:hypothetical protein